MVLTLRLQGVQSAAYGAAQKETTERKRRVETQFMGKPTPVTLPHKASAWMNVFQNGLSLQKKFMDHNENKTLSEPTQARSHEVSTECY